MSKRKTHSEFIEEMNEINADIEILGQYINNATKLKARCKIDNYVWDVRPTQLLRGGKCPQCNKKKQTKSHEDFVLEINQINSDIEILDKYINNHTKIKVRCLIDDNEWDVRPASLLKGYGCPKCSNRYKRSHEEFIEEISSINKNIEILGRYINNKTKLKCRCLIDGNEWDAIPSGLLQGQGCPKCGNVYKRNHSEFIEEMSVINKDIEILGKYINNREKIKCRCLIDNYEWEAIPSNLLRNQGCPKCAIEKRKEARRKPHSQFIDELKVINADIEVLGEYINNATRLKCRCLIDDYEWEAIPRNLLQGQGCPKCGGTMQKTHFEFVDQVKEINADIEILGQYTNSKVKVKCRCLIDNYEWDANPPTLLKGHGCPKCAAKRISEARAKTHEEFIEALHMINKNIEVLDKYNGARNRIKCRCLVDGNEWETTPDNLLQGCGCSKCGDRSVSEKLRKTHEQFINELKEINSDIEVLDRYSTNNTSIRCRCLVDGNEWDVLPSSLLMGARCPKCSNKYSKGEVEVDLYCKTNLFKYEKQYRINKCRYKHTLPFDFAIFNKDELIALIEYQGQQHYEPVDFAGKGDGWALKNFELQQKKDNIKRTYCKENNIPLIEIPYWIEDIERFIDDELGKINNSIQLTLI